MTAEGSTVAVFCPVWAQHEEATKENINHDNIKSGQDGVGGGLEKPRRECKAEYRPTLADRSH